MLWPYWEASSSATLPRWPSREHSHARIIPDPRKLRVVEVRNGIPVRTSEAAMRKRHHRFGVAEKSVHRRLGARQLYRFHSLWILRESRTHSRFLEHR